MEYKLITLKLFLDELNVPIKIDTIKDRKRVQKAVYLGQLSGVDLGYRFGWYKMGPYSPSLARDYYNLEDALVHEEQEFKGKEFKAQIKEKLDKITPALKKPESVKLENEEWLELLSSYHYLIKISKLNNSDIAQRINDEKPCLASYIEKAKTHLKDFRLL